MNCFRRGASLSKLRSLRGSRWNVALGFADHLIVEILFEVGVKEIITLIEPSDGSRVFVVCVDAH